MEPCAYCAPTVRLLCACCVLTACSVLATLRRPVSSIYIYQARIKQNGTDLVIGDFDNEVGGCIPMSMCGRLQPHMLQAATPCVAGCNPMCGRLQPQVWQAATPCVAGYIPMSMCGRLQPNVLEAAISSSDAVTTIRLVLHLPRTYHAQMSAALAYDKKARQMHGPRALVNFPDGPS